MKTETALENIVDIAMDKLSWWMVALLFSVSVQDLMAVMVDFDCFLPLFTVSTTTKSSWKVNNIISEICFQVPEILTAFPYNNPFI